MYSSNVLFDQRIKSSPSTWNNSSTSSSVHSFTEEPAASKWHHWAKEEDKQCKSVIDSPKIIHSPIQQQQQQRKFTFQSHEDPFRLVTSDPPVCFCKKPAHVSFTLEYGPILECHSYNYTTTTEEEEGDKVNSLKYKYTCGFHVHEKSWKKIKGAFLQGKEIDPEYSELQSCPLYNFTYCSIFYVTNKFDKIPPLLLPTCFCGKSVILRETNHAFAEHRPRYFFACPNSAIEGVKKCSWKLEANEVAFPRQKHRIHDRIGLKEYQQQFIIQQPQPNKQHQNELLATLTDSLKSSTNNNLVVPTSVLAKKQPTMSVSSSSTTTTSSSVVTSPIIKPETEFEELKLQYTKTMERIKKEYQYQLNQAQLQLEDSIEKLTQVELDFKDEITSMTFDLREETILRENCQNKLAHNEIDMANLRLEKEQITEEYLNYREEIKLKYGKDEERNKCKVCFHRTIEYVLIPCYHFAYCHPCAIKLKECAICRRSFTGIQKIYSC